MTEPEQTQEELQPWRELGQPQELLSFEKFNQHRAGVHNGRCVLTVAGGKPNCKGTSAGNLLGVLYRLHLLLQEVLGEARGQGEDLLLDQEGVRSPSGRVAASRAGRRSNAKLALQQRGLPVLYAEGDPEQRQRR